MAQPWTYKSTHYQSQLLQSLASGPWLAPNPGRTPSGSRELAWSELVRKWGKHCGNSAVGQEGEVLAEIAKGTQVLGSALASISPSTSASQSNHLHWKLQLEDECIVPDSSPRYAEVSSAYEKLKGIKSSSDVRTIHCRLLPWLIPFLDNPVSVSILRLCAFQTRRMFVPSRKSARYWPSWGLGAITFNTSTTSICFEAQYQ